MARNLVLDFDSILDVALKGLRRSSVFMGFGINAVSDSNNASYQLSNITQIQIIPDNVPPAVLKHFKEEFKIWIVAGALREITESFNLFLDELHRACSTVYAIRRKIDMEETDKRQANFAKEGLSKKLDQLERNYQVTPKRKAFLLLLNRARNCLTHRNGRVGPEDIKGETNFTVQWGGLDIFVEEPNGNKIYFSQMPEEGILLESGGTVKAQFVERHRTFDNGEMLFLSPRDLAEISWFYEREARFIAASGLAYARANGAIIMDSYKT